MKTRSAAGMSARTAIAVFDSDSDDDNRIVQNNRNVAQARPTAIVVVERPANYKNQALTLLKNEFPLLSVHAIVNAFAFNNSTFTPAFRALQEIQQTQASDPDNATARIRQKYPFLRHVNKVFIKTSRKGSPVTTNYNELLSQELDEIDEFNQKENRSLAGAVPTNAKHGTAKHEENDKNGNLKPAAVATVAAAQQQQEEDLCPIECQCCFGDYPFLEMCQCTEGHLFCVQCLEHHVNEQFHGKNSTTFHCMDSTGVEPCQGVFNRGQLDKLSEDFQRNYDVKVGRLQVEQALFEGCHSCPGCEYIGFSDDETIFVECPQCNLWYCKSCKESLNIHRNKTCETVKKEKEADKKTSATNQAAEAMTEAVVRKCPVCGLQCFKEEGCNKMTCPNQRCPTVGAKVRTKFCYLCREQITEDVGYNHFCRTPLCRHKTCGKCVLFTQAKEEDERARREAAMQQLANLKDADETEVAKLIGSPAQTTESIGKPQVEAPRRAMQLPHDGEALPIVHNPPPVQQPIVVHQVERLNPLEPPVNQDVNRIHQGQPRPAQEEEAVQPQPQDRVRNAGLPPRFARQRPGTPVRPPHAIPLRRVVPANQDVNRNIFQPRFQPMPNAVDQGVDEIGQVAPRQAPPQPLQAVVPDPQPRQQVHRPGAPPTLYGIRGGEVHVRRMSEARRAQEDRGGQAQRQQQRGWFRFFGL